MKTLEEIRRDQDRPTLTPAVTITHLDIPFEDVLCFALRLFAAQVLIGIPIAFVIWLAFLR